jgi:hypothetical protein
MAIGGREVFNKSFEFIDFTKVWLTTDYSNPKFAICNNFLQRGLIGCIQVGMSTRTSLLRLNDDETNYTQRFALWYCEYEYVRSIPISCFPQ